MVVTQLSAIKYSSTKFGLSTCLPATNINFEDCCSCFVFATIKLFYSKTDSDPHDRFMRRMKYLKTCLYMYRGSVDGYRM